MLLSRATLRALTLGLLLTVSCRVPPEPASQSDPARDARDVTTVLEDVLDRFASADAEGLLSHYAADVVVMLPSRRKELDKSATLAYYRDLFERMTPSGYTATRDVEVSGDRAFARATYIGTLRMVDGG